MLLQSSSGTYSGGGRQELAGLALHGLINLDEARAMTHDCAYRLAKQTYKL